MMNKKSLIILLLFVCKSNAMNWLRPYDTLIKPDIRPFKHFRFVLYGEAGVADARGYNSCGDRTNVLQIYNCDQDALAMLDGFAPCSKIGQKRAQLNVNDDGCRGHFCVTGDLKQDFAAAFSTYYFFTPHIAISAFLPVYRMRLTNVCWRNLTQNNNAMDMLVKEELTNNFFCNVCKLGCGLDLCDWERTGVGDLALFANWTVDYPQHRRILRNVHLDGRLGLNLPTGLRQDEDKIFAIPYGYDGAVGVFAGGGLDVFLGRHLKAGVDVELLFLFGNTRERRIKTDPCQTELLLLQKVCAYKDFGLTQRFNLYLEGFRLYKGFSFKVGYQFFKHGSDELSFANHCFSTNIANSARSLCEWTMHHIVLNASYDFIAHLSEESRVRPYISAYARIPFDGKRVAVVPAVGGVVSIDF